MTIDEAIAHAREVAESNRRKVENDCVTGRTYLYPFYECIKCAEEHEQLAEWLEELKSYRASVFSGDMTQSMLKEEYNKAIDDFVEKYKSCDNRSIKCRKALNCADCIAEQLKDGDGK